ncbi:MAG: UDP-N-acetylmuramoyl-L-alanine--D-glutamate ligase [Syntrophomonas sp.]
MDFAGKKILVVGLARSGMAAISLLHKRGAILTACDIKKAEELGEKINLLESMDVRVFAASYPVIDRKAFDMVVTSPGVRLEFEPIHQARLMGIPVISEVELAYAIKAPEVELCAVSGTNGKTTTTSLLQYIFAKDGRRSVAGGNIGVPLTTLIDGMEDGIITVEISSFQLETTINFKPHICGLLNITPDHLDWHKTLDNYIRAKTRIFANQTSDDYTILNYEDHEIRNMASSCKSKVLFFSTDRVLKEGAFVDDNYIKVIIDNIQFNICTLDEVLLRGKHNLENILCASAMAIAAGVDTRVLRQSLSSFKGIRHRLEEVASKNGVLYINDSKGTNPDSTIRAIESFNEPVILIAGGRNKGSDFAELAKLINNRVKELVILGEAREVIKTAVMETGFRNIHEVEDFSSAVAKAHELSNPGDVVLLSPACASWDMFDNYEQRGDLFCELVGKLENTY